MRLLGPETMHVTLCFLGTRPTSEIEALAAALAACRAAPVGELSLGAPLWLPPRTPRSLALEVHDDRAASLARLHAALIDAFAATIAWEPERRRFRAHVTVARLGRVRTTHARGDGRTTGEERGGEELLPATPWLSFTPPEVTLFRSWLEPAGARYEAVATRLLRASASSSASASSASSLGGVEASLPP